MGVFTSFTLSQTGMVVHWRRLRTAGWRHRAAMNGIGAFLTGIVTIVVLVTKFVHGAYLVVIAVAVLVTAFYTVRRHYTRVARFLEPQNPEQLERLGKVAVSRPRTTVVLFVSQVNELTARSLALGRGLSPDDFHAVTIASDPERVLALQRTWAEMEIDVPLVVVDSPYREFTRPAVEYIQSLSSGPGAHGNGHHPRVRGGALVGELPPQPECAPAQSRPPGRTLGGGDKHPVPHGDAG